jgi:uncharacterized protein YerC
MGMSKQQALLDVLRVALERDGRTHYVISREAGLRASVLCRFARGLTVTTTTAEKLADVLGYEIKLVRKRNQKGG